VQLDDGRLSFISTPHFFEERKLHLSDELANHAKHFSTEPSVTFAVEWGIGLGKSASSLMQVALYDMLLEWMDLEQMHLH
jgi:hypothetical protein